MGELWLPQYSQADFQARNSPLEIRREKIHQGPAQLFLLFPSSVLKVDYDVCSNYGNWLYSAGIGNDPRDNRKFNVIKQGLDYDVNVSLVRLSYNE